MRDESKEREPLRIVASGGLEIWRGEQRVDTRIPVKAALMIAYLADQPSPVSRARLAGLLWSDHPEEQARSSLRVALTRTRRHVPHLRSDRSTLGLEGDVTLDLSTIEIGSIAEVLSLHRGDAFAGIEIDGSGLFEDWVVQRREEHRTRLMRLLSGGARQASAEGRWNEVGAIGRRMIECEPWNEAAHRFVMTALAATDGRSSALAAYDRCAEMLRNEFGVSPEAETETLAGSIRQGSIPAVPLPAEPDLPAPRAIMWRLLGDVAVEIEGTVHDLGGRHRRSVMARLAVNAPERCSLEQLVAAVWGDDAPLTATQSIRRHVRALQDLFPEVGSRIESVPDGFRLMAVPHEVDAIDVRSTIANARSSLRHGETQEAVITLREAIDRWDGSSLGGVTSSGSLATARVALDELRLGAIEDLIEAELALGRHREIASEAESFAMEHPVRERAWANLMLARSRNGRRAEAVAAYRQFCDALAGEGLSPTQSIEALYGQIVDEAVAVRPSEAADAAGSTSWTIPATTFAVPFPSVFDRSAQVPLAGRAAELETLGEALGDASSRGPATIFMSGEPGIGKTRLAAELAKTAHEAGAAVLYGRCDEALGVPFRAWREALDHLAEHVPHHIARRHLDRFGPSLHLLIPSLAGGATQLPDPDNGDIDGSQQDLLFRATTSLLGDVAKRRRLVVVLDDMQWAHDSTLGLMRHLARQADEPIVLMCLYRSTEVPEDHPLHRIVVELEQAEAATVVGLEELDEDAQAELVRSIVIDGDDAQARKVAARIAEQTGGNPFFFTEVLRSMKESDSVGSMADGAPAAQVPPTVQRVVAQRVSRLGSEVATTLRAASLFGREFDMDILANVVGRGEEEVLGDVEAAVTAGLLTDAPLGRDRFAFTHDLLHHTLAAELSHSRRGRIHGQIARATEDMRGPDLGDDLPVVAGHLVAAEDRTQQAHTVRRCREAGNQAGRRLAMSEAATWFQLALDRLDPNDAAERARVLVELGTQQRNAGLAEHRATLIEAGQLAQVAGDTETLVSATLINSRGMNAHVWELDTERITMLRAALDALGDIESADRAELLAALANEQWDADHRAEAEAYYREAMNIARRVGHPETLARVLVRVSRARNFKLARADMASASEELRELSGRLGRRDPLLLANCLSTVLNTSIRLGLAAETQAAIDAIRVAADELPLPMFTLPAHLARCLEAGLQGDIQAYESASVDTFHHATSIGDEEAGFIFEGQMFYTSYLRGDLAPILEFSIKVMHERPEVPLYRAVCTLIHVEAGQTEEAQRLLDAEVGVGIEPSVDMFQIQALVAWADAAASIHHGASCAQLYDALVGLSSEMSGHLVQVGEPIDISLGRLASSLHRFDDAERHFVKADDIASSFGAAWMQAKTAISRAEMFVRRGATGDSAAAIALAEEVRAMAAEHDYRNIAHRATTVVQNLR